MVGKSLPAKWKRINVHDNRAALGVGARISYPNNLFLKKQTNSPNIFADWLPHEEEDPRVVPKGKKRRAFSYSTGTDDPRKAAQSAIAWVVDKQKELIRIEISSKIGKSKREKR